MKTIISILACFILAGCVSKTDFGPCIGVGDDENQELKYHVSTRNIIVGIIFVETIVVPVVVAVDEYKCPVAKKGKP